MTLILLLVSAVPALAGVAAGDRAYANGDYQTAFREWEPAARHGDSDAQYGLALLYHYGLGVRQDYRRAALWYERAVDQGHIPQNINFAIKTLVARNFLDANDIAYELAPSEATLTAADVAEQARQYTVLIECYD